MSLRQQTFSAARWTALSSLLRALLQFGQTIVLARMLMPSEFGLMAIVTALLAVIGLFADLGLSRALVHFREISAEALSSMFWLSVGVSFGLVLLLSVAAPGIAGLYGEPVLAPVLIVASLALPLSASGQQFRVLAEKELRFSTLARIEIASDLAGFLAAVAMAWMAAGVYALVGGMLVTSLCNTLCAWIWLSVGRRPRGFLRIADARPYLIFGGYLVGDNLASTLHREADVFIGGTVAGPAAMGFYAVPRELSLRVANSIINPVITRIAFPVMAQVQDDRAALKSIYLRTVRMTASLNCPLYILLGLFASETVSVLYGPRWHDAAIYLQLFAAWGLVRSVGNPVGSLIYAVGRTRMAFWWNVGLLVSMPPALWLGATLGGLEGLAWAMLISHACVFIPMWQLLVRPSCGAAFGEYLGQLLPPLLLALSAGAVAALVALAAATPTARLAVGLSSGLGLYVALSHRFNRPWVEAMRTLLLHPRLLAGKVSEGRS